jgi:hypothetical protein
MLQDLERLWNSGDANKSQWPSFFAEKHLEGRLAAIFRVDCVLWRGGEIFLYLLQQNR